MNEEFDPEEEKGFSLAREAYDWVESALSAMVCVLILFVFVGRVITVEGISMEPTLHENNRLICSNLLYTPAYKDIVVVVKPNMRTSPLIKRVIATGGQTIDIDFAEGVVYVDGEALDEPYTAEPTHWQSSDVTYPIEVPEGYVFVMGDNRNHSWDSRVAEVGLVDERYILGRVVYRVLPYSEMGRVY